MLGVEKMFVNSIIWFCVLTNFVSAEEKLFLNTAQILEYRNISHELHKVVTEDGYILTIFRIPRKERRGVVVLQHSLSIDSSMFLISQKRSVAMEIYNNGYELWLPNFRGLPLSDSHQNPDIKKLEYWNFSFHEIGYYDLPAIINHVTNVTGTKVIVINHSLSATASVIYSALRPDEAEKNVKVFVNQATSAFMNHTETPLKYLIGIGFSIFKPLMEMLNLGALGYDFSAFEKLGKQLALLLFPKKLLTSLLKSGLDFLYGTSGMRIDPEELPMIISQGAQAVGTKILYHYSQIIQSGRFCMYDFGTEENLRRYNSSEPPDYPLANIRVPIFLVISEADTISDSWGSNLLYEKLPAAAKIYGKLDIKNMNHGDYLIGNGRFEYFAKIIKFINSVP